MIFLDMMYALSEGVEILNYTFYSKISLIAPFSRVRIRRNKIIFGLQNIVIFMYAKQFADILHTIVHI